MSGQVERINTPSLIAIENAARRICYFTMLPKKVFDLVQMLVVRTLGNKTFNEYDTQLYMIACFKITLDFYDIEMTDFFWLRMGILQYPGGHIDILSDYILNLFPKDSHIYLDQFITPQTKKENNNEEINFWNDEPIIENVRIEQPRSYAGPVSEQDNDLEAEYRQEIKDLGLYDSNYDFYREEMKDSIKKTRDYHIFHLDFNELVEDDLKMEKEELYNNIY